MNAIVLVYFRENGIQVRIHAQQYNENVSVFAGEHIAGNWETVPDGTGTVWFFRTTVF
jgi:hypothetical protein